MITPKWERSQQDHVRVHPQPAVLVEHGVAEDVAEISDLGGRDDPLEQATRYNVVGWAHLDALRPQKLKPLRRIAPYPDRMACSPHRRGGGDQTAMSGLVGAHLVETVDLRKGRAATQKRCDPRVEFARQPASL